MDPIRSRPRALSTPTSATKPQASTQQAAAPARTNAVGHSQLNTFRDGVKVL